MSGARRLLRTVLWLSRPHLAAHGFPLCHNHRSSRGPVGGLSPAKVGWVIGNQIQLCPRPGQSSRNHSFGKRVRDVTVRGQSFIDNALSTRFVTFIQTSGSGSGSSMTSSMSQGNRWWRGTSKLSLNTRFVCSCEGASQPKPDWVYSSF